MEFSPKNNQLHETKTSSDDDLPVPITEALKSIIKKEQYITYKIDWRRPTDEVKNYFSTLYKIEVSGRTKDEERELHLFVKYIIDGTVLEIVSLPKVFVNELFAYKELFKTFAEMQTLANVPLEKIYQTVKIYEESNERIIILENISKNGFTAIHTMNKLTLNFFEMSVKELARFHGLSFALRETRSEYFADKIKPLRYPFTFGEEWIRLVTSLREVGINHVDEQFRDKLDQVFEDAKVKYGQYLGDATLKVCLCHGDYKFINIMTKTIDGENKKVMPIDYQLIHYGCPIFDFLFLIFTGTDREFRKANLLNLKELYYETLSDFLGYFNLDVDTVYPRENFEKVYKEKLDFGLMCAMMFYSFVLAAKNDLPGDNELESYLQYKQEMKGLYQGVIEDFIIWGYL